MSRMSVMAVASTMRWELLSRLGVGCRWARSRTAHDARLAIPLPHDRDGCRSNAEQLGIGSVNVYSNRKPRREMHPVECALDIGQAAGKLTIFRKDAVADALHVACESAVRVSHHVNIDVGSNVDVF